METGKPSTPVDEMVEMRGLRFHFRDWPARRENAPSLVLLHGFTGHARSWDPFAAAMTDRYRVLALDLRGHGETGWPVDSDYGIESFVADLDGFVAALGLEGFSLIGLSMGGLAVMAYAGRRPAALAAGCIVDFGPELAAAGLGRIRSNVTSTDVFSSREEAFAVARTDHSRPPEALHRHRSALGLMRTEDGRWTYRYDPALRRPGTRGLPEPDAVWRSCANIGVPTLILRGELSDILSPEIAERMVRTIPDARLATVAGAGHGVPYDAPEGFAAAARAFFKG